MSILLWKRMLREDPRAYRARVLYFSSHQRMAALREYLLSLSEAEYLQHLEVLFPPGELTAADFFSLGLSWRGPGTFHYTLGAYGSDASSSRPEVRDVDDLHWRAVFPWVRAATRQRGMASWRGVVSSSSSSSKELLATCLAELPDARLSTIDLKHQEGYAGPSGWDVLPSIYVEALLEFSDSGSLRVALGHWPEQEKPQLEEWARQQLPRPASS